MGTEIRGQHFEQSDFDKFELRLKREEEILHEWFAERRFSRRGAVAGLELEGWLVDAQGLPQPANDAFLERANDPSVVPELSKFNFEVNVLPQALEGRGLEALEAELRSRWRRCQAVAREAGGSVLSIGTLPTVCDGDLTLENISSSNRYRALNEQLKRLREGRPLTLEVVGVEHLRSVHHDVMLEAAATSFQLHLQVPQALAGRYWNAASIASAVTVAASANSPLLFGKILWEETRIPLFEQAIDIPSPEKRVFFGFRYVQSSVEEILAENQKHFPVLLPIDLQVPEEKLAHLRLHNGCIWRWNRPLIGFDDDGTPHLRVEHRVMAAGPTVTDMIASAALFYGLVEWMVMEPHAPEFRLPFATAKDNFYEAARLGLGATIDWYDGRTWNISRLILEELLEQAEKGLRALHMDDELAGRYLAIIEERVSSGQTGAVFQRRFVEKYGRDMGALVRAYRDRQATEQPVHTWML